MVLLKTPKDSALSGYIVTCHQLIADDILVWYLVGWLRPDKQTSVNV